jgi:hypothetical protein
MIGGKTTRFRKNGLNSNVKRIIYKPGMGWVYIRHQRAGLGKKTQYYPVAELNRSDDLLHHRTPAQAVANHPAVTSTGKPRKGAGIHRAKAKQDIASKVSKILRGGCLSTL